MSRVVLLAKQLLALAFVSFVGYLSAQFVISVTLGGGPMLVVLSMALTMLFTPAWYIPWIRSLRLPCWLVSFLPTIVMYLMVLYERSVPSISALFLGGAFCFVPALIAWLVSLSMMRHSQQQD